MTGAIPARAAGFLGLCMRAGQVSIGQEACVAAVRGHTAQLVLLDMGSGANTLKRLMDSCQTHGVPLYQWPEDSIAQAVGKRGLKVAAVRRGAMGQKLQALLDAAVTGSGGDDEPAAGNSKPAMDSK